MSAGCIIGLLLGILIVPVVGFLLLVTWARKSSHAHKEAVWIESRHGDSGRISFAYDAPPPEVYRAGDSGPSLEQYVWFRITDSQTTLARQEFAAAAQGKEVRWDLKLDDLRLDGGEAGAELVKAGIIRGTFEVSYEIATSARSRSGSSRSIEVIFADSERDRLIEFSRGVMVPVTGKLNLQEKGKDQIIDARVGGAETTPEA